MHNVLNEKQREAVYTDAGPLLVFAGAGSGKTRVITHKIARMIFEHNVSPYRIMALTFTNKAAREMVERIENLVHVSAKGMWIGTFHSQCARILRREKVYGGVFTIYDTDDQKKLLKNILADLGLGDSKRFSPNDVQHRISSLKNRLITPVMFRDAVTNTFDELFVRIYAEYERRLSASQALDFDDLIFRVIELFKGNNEVCEKYQENILYLLVDEYQDTNLAQYELIKILASRHRNITVVGDDDQAIYSWRGADIRNILEFEKTFPDAHIVRLEQNYRSTKTILDASNSLIRRNKERKEKSLWTENEGGEKVDLVYVVDERDEAAYIARQAQGSDGPGTAVFYRTNAQSRSLEEAFRNNGIPYVIVGGLRFYERKEIKDVLAYLRLIVNPADDISLERIINVPRRGIGEKTMDELRRYARENNQVLFQAVQNYGRLTGLTQRERDAVAGFKNRFEDFQAYPRDDLKRFVSDIVRDSGYLQFLEQSSEEGVAERLENVGELITAVQEYCDRTPEATLEGFLEEVSLITDIDTLADNGGSHVTLMTLHSSKGLEFDRVFVTGVEEGLLPLIRDNDENDTEEERRLMYVGMTRARKKLCLIHAAFRSRYGSSSQAVPSSFLDEISSECLRKIDNTGGRFRELASASGGSAYGAGHKRHPGEVIPLFENFSQVESTYRKGQKIYHPIWGPGMILSVSGFNENMKAEIKFQNASIKKVMVKYARLEFVGDE